MKTTEPAICIRCVLPASFPGVTFSDDGVCNYCRDFPGLEEIESEKEEYRKQFEALVEQHRRKDGYDCLVCFSGGKDSTYTLDLFRTGYDLKVLAFTLDNGFISPVAKENIVRVVESLDVDHVFFKPRFQLLKKIYSTSASGDLYSPKSLERASGICTSCIGIVKFSSLRLAIDKNIPFIGFGWSPGQAPIRSSVMRTNPQFVRANQKAIQKPLLDRLGSSVNVYFLQDHHFEDAERFPYNVHPLAFHEYCEEKIYSRMAELSWEKPPDTDPNSTNCLLNAYANAVHEKRYGFNPYVFEVAKLVREGVLARDEGLRRFDEKSSEQELVSIQNRLDR